MTDRIRDLFVLGLLGMLAWALGDVTAREGQVALGLATLLLASLLLLRRRAGPGALHRVIFLGAVLFLAVQPFSVDQADAVPIPTRALLVLGAVLVLWTHMNVQSVSGKLAWSFSSLDVGVLGACSLVVFLSLGLLWYRADAAQVVPQILLQGVALACGVLYLYLSRWRPARPTFLLAAIGLTALLVASFLLGRSRAAELRSEWDRLAASWEERAPEPGEVEDLVARARRAAPSEVPDVWAEAGRAALAGGRPQAAAGWIARAFAEGPDRLLPNLARVEQATLERDDLARREALSAVAAVAAGGPPRRSPLPATARDVAVELLDRGRPSAALLWLPSPGGSDVALLRAEAALALGDADAAQRGFGERRAGAPLDLEGLLGIARARLLSGDRDGALLALERARGRGAPAPLILPLLAELGAAGDPQADSDRRMMSEGIVVVERDGWEERHANGNFLLGGAEDRRVNLVLAPGRPYELRIEARGEPARGEFPRLAVELDGEGIATRTIDTLEWGWFPIRLTPSRSGATLRLTFENDWFQPGGEDRNLVLGRVVLRSLPP